MSRSALRNLYAAGREVFIVWSDPKLPPDGPYGVELRRRAVAFNEALEAARAELGLCDPDRDLHFHGTGDSCECGARPNTAWADPTPFSEGTVRPEVPKRILGVDLEEPGR